MARQFAGGFIKPFKISKEMTSPSKEEIESEIFGEIFNLIKDWDINVPDYYSGYTSGNGSHVKLILDVINPIIRDYKINKILNDRYIEETNI
jgi:hypothetical protein